MSLTQHIHLFRHPAADALAGAGAGVVATGAMTALMVTAQKAGFMGRLPPAKITDAALDAAGVDAADVPKPARNVATAITHFGFGAACGALFGFASRRLRARVPLPVQGMLFGSAVWLVSYMGWVPALKIMPPATHDRPDRPVSMVLAHWLYGAVLGALVARR